ncbi:hypothetical protein [Paramaledivibacter caminithermalis]|jgi:hypothetical protein|uniref:Uncharacterized protein n=1 Tax=Paramaledivibacter caminithermalis (strain DSM 15212 / CIP 107654 / DViRD3) TaxID=1121301 RepID=A0A1M6KJ70_PARC5|nr:hypothetical protein [Paramaledivibacter caminithermalis]SHJ58975.1 hypothetical protein SAMN02745912_00426 [Paramaledivibacter caminithermalis DSM 15212]
MKKIIVKITSENDRSIKETYEKAKIEVPFFMTVDKNYDEYQLRDLIDVPEEAFLSRDSGSFKLDPKFIIWIIKYCKENNKGLAIIHNHFNNPTFSLNDLNAEKVIRKLANKYGVICFINGIISTRKYYFRIFNYNSLICFENSKVEIIKT